MCAPESPPLDLTLAVMLDAIQDQLDQLTKVCSVSPVCVAGRSDSRRVCFDLSPDRGEQDYRYTQDDLRDDRHSCSDEYLNDWDNEE